MTYPLTIIDNFFEDPDQIVENAKKLKTYNSPGNWPGSRTKMLHIANHRLFEYFCNRIYKIFSDDIPEYYNMQTQFQFISPLADEQWDKRNRGWIHQDLDTWFGGIVYLNKNPEPNTGTTIYRPKYGFTRQTNKELNHKEALYRNEELDLDEYNKAWDIMYDQYIETVKIENVYNRFVLFPAYAHHGVETYGHKQERITLNFFGREMTGHIPPNLRSV